MPTPTATDDIIASNREAWNESARHHQGTDTWHALTADIRQAEFSCFDDTLTQLLKRCGVEGKATIQLGCNNGRETFSLMGLGAQSAVGVDQSEGFLAQARLLADLSPHAVSFVQADIHQLPDSLLGRFDLALITIGVLNWMPDLAVFFRSVAATLKPGGILVIYETHPFLEMFDPAGADPFRPVDSYFRTAPFVDDEVIVYEGASGAKGAASYWFMHRMSDIITAVLDAGLRLEHFKEYPHSNREECYDQYEQRPAQLPMSYTLTASKPAA